MAQPFDRPVGLKGITPVETNFWIAVQFLFRSAPLPISIVAFPLNPIELSQLPETLWPLSSLILYPNRPPKASCFHASGTQIPQPKRSPVLRKWIAP